MALLEFTQVSKRFSRSTDWADRALVALGLAEKPSTVHALDQVCLSIAQGEVLGLVGESGCGKSTLGRVGARLLEPTDGQVRYRGKPLHQAFDDRTASGGLPLQLIFQDPYASLNPRLRAGDAIAEGAVVHGLVDAKSSQQYVSDLLTQVGLDPSLAQRFPHQFSGGQRARLGIARALAVKPEFLICDEAVAALDVSIQAQVLNLFMDLRERLGLSYLFISHDLAVVRHLSDRIAVMYLGRVVEVGPTQEIYRSPNHPYTAALLAEVPRLDKRRQHYIPIRGEIPSPLNPPSGCHFHPRCQQAHARCSQEVPVLREIAPGRLSACHLNDRLC
jgi:peptide/nickel transport system ATP-binding protein